MYFSNLQCSPIYALPRLLNMEGEEKYLNHTDYKILDPVFLRAILDRYLNSPDALFKITEKNYYNGVNDITIRPKYVIGRKDGAPALYESPVLSNKKISHNFLNTLISQKVSLLLGNKFTVKPDIDLDYSYINVLKAITVDAMIYGVGFIYASDYHKIERLNPIECLPIWRDRDSFDLQGLIRYYKTMTFKDGNFVETKTVDLYQDTFLTRYEEENGGRLVFKESIPYFLNSDKKAVDLKLPVIPVVYNSGNSVLKSIKALVDEYDSIKSDIGNAIADIPNSIKVIKGYSGNDRDGFTNNLNRYRTAFLDEDGEVSVLQTPLNISEQYVHLKEVRKDIFSFGRGLDTGEDSLGNSSGSAIRYRYSSLLNDVQEFSVNLNNSLVKAFELYGEEVEFIFNITNDVLESQTIEDIKNSVGILSKKTLIEMHPYVGSLNEELERLGEESDEEKLYVGSPQDEVI